MRNFTAHMKEGPDGRPFITLKMENGIGLGDNQIVLYLAPRTKSGTATTLATALNAHVQAIRLEA